MNYPVPYISYSQLSSFLDCPQTFYQTYILKNRLGNKYTCLGSQLHSVFEWQGRQHISKSPWSKERLMKEYNQLFFNNEKVPKKYFADKEDYIAMYKKGCIAIDNFYEYYYDSKPLFIEKKFRSVLVEDTPECLGFIDRIDGEIDKPEEWIITDYKSGGSVKSKDFLRKDFQLAIYAQFIKNEFGEYPAVLRYAHPVIDKFQDAVHLGGGTYEYTKQRSPVVQFTVIEKMKTVKETVEAISKAYANKEWPKEIDKWSCKMCFHLETCKPFGDGTGWNSL